MIKKIDFTKEIPELAGLIDISRKIEQMEAMLQAAKQVQSNIASNVIQKLIDYEHHNNIWLGQDILVSYNNIQYIIKGLTDDENELLSVIPIEHSLIIQDKQTNGKEGEKEGS